MTATGASILLRHQLQQAHRSSYGINCNKPSDSLEPSHKRIDPLIDCKQSLQRLLRAIERKCNSTKPSSVLQMSQAQYSLSQQQTTASSEPS
jgi:hypothetical protein